jgi:hypothetical protein
MRRIGLYLRFPPRLRCPPLSCRTGNSAFGYVLDPIAIVDSLRFSGERSRIGQVYLPVGLAQTQKGDQHDRIPPRGLGLSGSVVVPVVHWLKKAFPENTKTTFVG